MLPAPGGQCSSSSWLRSLTSLSLFVVIALFLQGCSKGGPCTKAVNDEQRTGCEKCVVAAKQAQPEIDKCSSELDVFLNADEDNSGTLTLEEAKKAGISDEAFAIADDKKEGSMSYERFRRAMVASEKDSGDSGSDADRQAFEEQKKHQEADAHFKDHQETERKQVTEQLVRANDEAGALALVENKRKVDVISNAVDTLTASAADKNTHKRADETLATRGTIGNRYAHHQRHRHGRHRLGRQHHQHHQHLSLRDAEKASTGLTAKSGRKHIRLRTFLARGHHHGQKHEKSAHVKV